MTRDDEVFWDRLADMPWIEAELECVKRREEVALQKCMLDNTLKNETRKRQRDEIVSGLNDCNGQLTLLNERIKWLRKVQERVRWVDACKAILDHETYMEIKVHMEMAAQATLAECPAPLLPYHPGIHK